MKSSLSADRRARFVTVAALAIGIAARLWVCQWSNPWTPHHPDEHILPLEAVALWEGVTPREVGWPGSTHRLAISAAAGATMLAETGRELWRERRNPQRIADRVAVWNASQYVDPTRLYKIGRSVSLAAGILQLVLTAWMVAQWTGAGGVAIGTLLVALSPVAILHSQYVLADITGALFITIALGLAATSGPLRIVATGIVVGLATASKFHFGIWLLVPVLGAALMPNGGRLRRCGIAAAGAGAMIWTVVTLVPWCWTNPLLAIKEFLGVVLVKTGSPLRASAFVADGAALVSAIGWMSALALPGAWAAVQRERARVFAPVVATSVVAAMGLLSATVMFERYGLVLLPGVALLAGLGWQSLRLDSRVRRSLAAVGLTILVVASAVTVVSVERTAGEPDVDVLVRQWVLQHVPRGSRIAVHDEDNAFLPRTANELKQCIAESDSPSAYLEKWRVEGITTQPAAFEPLRRVVLNDEEFAAYWCGRELTAQADPGFFVIPYHQQPRFGAMLEREVIAAFTGAATARVGSIDVMVLNRQVETAGPPSAVLSTARGVRAIYVTASRR